MKVRVHDHRGRGGPGPGANYLHFGSVEDAVRACVNGIEDDDLRPFLLVIDGEEVMDRNRISKLWSTIMQIDPEREHLSEMEWKTLGDGSVIFYPVNGRSRNIEKGVPVLEHLEGESRK